MKSILLLTTLLLTISLAACRTAPRNEDDRATLRSDAEAAINLAYRTDPTLAQAMGNAAGYAVFPTVGKGAFLVGGAFGRGVVFQNGVAIGFTTITQISAGATVGGQSYTQIIVFSTPEALQRFRSGNFTFNAQTSAVALHSGAGANARFSDGVAVFTMGEGGMMLEAAIGGQRFSFEPI